MPDTPRTVAELQALFADNNSGDISAQDLRDFVVSQPARGALINNATNFSISSGSSDGINWDTDARVYDTEGLLVGDVETGTGLTDVVMLPSGLSGLYVITASFTVSQVATKKSQAWISVGSDSIGSSGVLDFLNNYIQVITPPFPIDDTTHISTFFWHVAGEDVYLYDAYLSFLRVGDTPA